MFLTKKLEKSEMTENEKIMKIEKKWKKISSENKMLYEQLAYIEMVFLGNFCVMKKKRKQDTSRRKEDWHPYLLFCKQNRENVISEGISGSSVMKKLSFLWKNLSEKEKEKYVIEAKQNKQKDLENEMNEKNKIEFFNPPTNLTIPVVSNIPIVDVVTEIDLNGDLSLSRLPLNSSMQQPKNNF